MNDEVPQVTSTQQSGQCSHEACAEYKRMWQKPVSRRNFLSSSLGIMAVGASSPHMLLSHQLLNRLGRFTPGATPTENILVIVQQGGGNDGLNTVVPYASSLYYSMRPTLAISQHSALKLDSTAGLHPNLTGFKQLWDAGHLAVVQGVGYSNATLSHFESTRTWQTADPSGQSMKGWLGTYLDTALGTDANPLKAVAIGDSLPLAFNSYRSMTPAIQSVSDYTLYTDFGDPIRQRELDAFTRMNAPGDGPPNYAAIRLAQRTTLTAVDELQAVPTDYTGKVPYPQTDLANQLQLVAQLINAGLGTRVFWVEQDGYDDHSHEAGDHAALLQELNDAVLAFYGDMQARGWHRKVMLMTWSEFGRRVQENSDHGTDHGTAAPMLLMGGSVKGGVFGKDPVLSHLDGDGNLIYDIDFRSVYSTVLANWLHADPTPVVGKGFETIPFV